MENPVGVVSHRNRGPTVCPSAWQALPGPRNRSGLNLPWSSQYLLLKYWASKLSHGSWEVRNCTSTYWKGGAEPFRGSDPPHVSPPSHQNLYESIKNEPFKIPEDDGNDLTHTFFNPDREGWLLKLGECVSARGKAWPTRNWAADAVAWAAGSMELSRSLFAWGSVATVQLNGPAIQPESFSLSFLKQHIQRGGSWLQCSVTSYGPLKLGLASQFLAKLGKGMYLGRKDRLLGNGRWI